MEAEAHALGLAPQWDEAPDADPSVEVYPENWHATLVALGMGTQWTYRPDGRRAGMAYASVPHVLDMMGISADERTPELYGTVRILEAEILDALDEVAGGR